MPDFDSADRYRLLQYASDLRMWFQAWLLEPVHKALSGTVEPSRLTDLYAEMNRFEARLGENLGIPITIEQQDLPLLKRVLLFQKQKVAHKQEELRHKSADQDIMKKIDSLSDAVTRLMSQDWFMNVNELTMPRLTEFLILQAAYQVLPMPIASGESRYDEKFGILQSPGGFLAGLRNCRTESWLRGTPISVAFIDIDDFKKFNTKYTETTVDRDLLPHLMQTLESHVYAHGFAYRFGGDEYVLLLPNMPSDSALQSLRELQEKLQSLSVRGIDDSVTVSIGVCTLAADSILTDIEVQDRANRAKAFAKKAGKNCIAIYRSASCLEKDLYIP